MPIITNPGCMICGKSRLRGTMQCPEHQGKVIEPRKMQEEEKPQVRWTGPAGIDCNHCRVETSCKGHGLMPANSCSRYVPSEKVKLGWRD